MNYIVKTSLITLGLLLGVSAYGQKENGKRNHEKIEAEKIGFLTQKLELTPDQAQTFFPLYREHKNKERELRKNTRPKKGVTELSDQESEALLNQLLQNRDEIHIMEKHYHAEYRKILDAKQMLSLLRAEYEFKQRLIKNISERRKARRQGREGRENRNR